MGNSCLAYNGQHKFVSDFELEIVANALLYYLDEFVSLHENRANVVDLLELRKHWKSILIEPINGAIDLNLDKYFSKKLQRQFLSELLFFSKRKLVSNSAHISCDILNTFFPYEVQLEHGEISSKLVANYFDKIVEFVAWGPLDCHS